MELRQSFSVPRVFEFLNKISCRNDVRQEGDEMGNKDDMNKANCKDSMSTGKEESEKMSKECCAEQLLAAKDSTGMTLEKATQILADDSSDDDAKAAADELLATADESGLDMDSAEKVLAECNSSENPQAGVGKKDDESKSIGKEKGPGADEESFNKASIGSKNDEFGRREE